MDFSLTNFFLNSKHGPKFVLVQYKSLKEVEIRLKKIRRSLPGNEDMEEEEENEQGRGDYGNALEEKEKEEEDISDRDYVEDELSELMQQR